MTTTLPNTIRALLAEHPGTVALRAERLDGHVLLGMSDTHVFPAASTIKVPLLVRALQRVQRGEFNLNDRIVMHDADRVGGSGILRELDGGLPLTWRDTLTLMTIVSDNTATNLIIEQLGIDDVNAFLTREGLHDTTLVGPLQVTPDRFTARQHAGERNRTTARDMTALLGNLARGALLSPELTSVALDILSRQHHKDILGRHVRVDAHGEALYRVASKAGALPGVRHDVGIVWTPQPLVLAVLSEGGRDPRYHPDNGEVQLLARVAHALLTEYGRMPAPR